VRAVAAGVARRVVLGRVGRAHRRGVALVEVPRADQLPARTTNRKKVMSGENKSSFGSSC
jgi:hypothetical protein